MVPRLPQAGLVEIPGIYERKAGYSVPFNCFPLFGWSGAAQYARFRTLPHVDSAVVASMFAYQKEALLWALSRPQGCNLWQPCGAGKTYVGAAWLAHLPGTSLVLCKAAGRET